MFSSNWQYKGHFVLQRDALAVEMDEGLLWFWIGTHAEYDQLLSQPRS